MMPHICGAIWPAFFRFPDPGGLASCRRAIPLFVHDVRRTGSLKGAMRATVRNACVSSRCQDPVTPIAGAAPWFRRVAPCLRGLACSRAGGLLPGRVGG